MKDAPAAPRRRLIRLLRGGRIALLAYLGLSLVLSRMQEALIFPGRATQGDPEVEFTPPSGAERVRLTTATGDRIVSLFGPALQPDGSPRADAATRPTVLFFYGNGSCLKDSLGEFAAFRRLGVNVLIPEYVGYGLSTGHAGEPGCYATAGAAYEHLRSRTDIDPAKIVASGWSLGGAVAIDLAARRPVAGVATFSAFTSMVEMARAQYPFLPVSLLLRHRFESERKIRRVTAPAFIAHGRRDSLITYAMSDRLAAAAGGPVTRLAIDHAGHNDLFDVGGDPLRRAFGAWLDAIR